MPTKILTWNIERFTDSRINPVGQRQFNLPYSNDVTSVNMLRFKYILRNIRDSDADIFVLIELNSDQGPRGSLISGNGQTGVLRLLTVLRNLQPENDWCLVPPVRMVNKLTINQEEESIIGENSYTEAVGVFYKNRNLEFTGPFVWPAFPSNSNSGKTAVPPSPNVRRGPYPDIWQQCLPKDNYYAGMAIYNDGMNGERFFYTEKCRNPFYTQFRERGGLGRTLNIVSVHYPPSEDAAKTAFTRTLELFGKYRLKSFEIMLITGDYNIDARTNYFFFPLTEDLYGFETLLRYSDSPPTIYKKPADAIPPDDYRRPMTLDNVSIKYGQNARGVAPTVQVIDRVMSSPPSPFQSLLYTPMAQIMQLPPKKRYTVFRWPFNFGTIGKVSGDEGTSDHLPLLVTI